MSNLAKEISFAQEAAIDELNQIDEKLTELQDHANLVLDELTIATSALGKDISFSRVVPRYDPPRAFAGLRIALPHVFFRIFLKDEGSYDICFLIDGTCWVAMGLIGENQIQLEGPTIGDVVEFLREPILEQAKQSAIWKNKMAAQ